MCVEGGGYFDISPNEREPSWAGYIIFITEKRPVSVVAIPLELGLS